MHSTIFKRFFKKLIKYTNNQKRCVYKKENID